MSCGDRWVLFVVFIKMVLECVISEDVDWSWKVVCVGIVYDVLCCLWYAAVECASGVFYEKECVVREAEGEKEDGVGCFVFFFRDLCNKCDDA